MGRLHRMLAILAVALAVLPAAADDSNGLVPAETGGLESGRPRSLLQGHCAALSKELLQARAVNGVVMVTVVDQIVMRKWAPRGRGPGLGKRPELGAPS
jgi:hypothetical protein